MLRNYLKIAYRNLVKNKMFSAINIFGLAIGIATCLLITLYVVDELTFDKFHEKGSRIYRLNNDILYGGKDIRMAQTTEILAPTLKKDYPQYENYIRLFNAGAFLIKKPSEANFIREENILFADSTVFEIFTFPLIAGNPKTVLNEPTVIVISEAAAKRHFGKENPIGKTPNLDNKKDYKITGVMKDIPANSHIKADFFISMKSLNYDWGNFLSNNQILVACLGLFGLVTSIAEQRVKEIGILKSASVVSILQLLSRDFLKLIILSIVFATPVAYYFMQKWLHDFEYRINIEWWVFIATGAIAILIALLTVSYQVIKAAMANPVKSLKTE